MRIARFLSLAAFAVSFAHAAAPAQAQEAKSEEVQGTSDIRCLAIMLQLTHEPDPTAQQAVTLGSAYFLGRLDAAGGTVEIEKRIADELVKMTAESLEAERMRCGGLVTARGQALAVIGAHLVAR